MSYQWHDKTAIEVYEDYCLFVNPEHHTWLKGKSMVKELFDDIIQGKERNDVPEEIKNKLINRFTAAKILTSNNTNAELQEDKTNTIESLYLVTTRTCNLRCSFCSIESGPEVEDDYILSFEEIRAIVDELSNVAVKRVILTGGEPLMRPQLLAIISYIHNKLSCKISLSTNGLLMTEEFINQISDKVASLDISLENIFESREQKEKLLDVISILDKHNISLTFSYVLTKENWKNIFAFLDIAVRYNAAISIKPVAPSGRAENKTNLHINIRELNEIYLKIIQYIYDNKYAGENIKNYIVKSLVPDYGCAAKGDILCMYPDGGVYACHSLKHPQFYYGNIVEAGIEGILNKREERKKSKEYDNCFNVDKRATCKTCKVRYFCQGGCLSDLFIDNQVQEKIPIDCEIKKNMINFTLLEYNHSISFLDNLKNYITMLQQSI